MRTPSVKTFCLAGPANHKNVNLKGSGSYFTYSVITDHSSQRWFDSFASVVVLAVGVFTHHCFPIQDVSHPALNRLLSIDCDGQLECNGA